MSQGPRLIHTIDKLPFLGGRLCLDFVNTVNWKDDEPLDERLSDLSALKVWAQRQGLIGGTDLTGDILDAQRFRAVLRRCLLIAEVAGSADLEALDRVRCLPSPLARGADGRYRLARGEVSGVLSLVAQSAAEVLLTGSQVHLKACPGERCGWLFLDESPSGRRRWCSMAVCGNRAKAKRHYRQQSQSSSHKRKGTELP